MSANDKSNDKLQTYIDILKRLRQEPFNQRTEDRLANHPYLLDAEAGNLNIAQKRAFVCEQFAIQRSDAISFAHLAGHTDFFPVSLASTSVPTAKTKDNKEGEVEEDLFQFLLGGEIYAASLLLDHAKSLGLEDEQAIESYIAYNSDGCLSPLAQAYPSYWARLALNQEHAAAAAACAVNFPAWGRMCQRLVTALETQAGNADNEKNLAFIKFFATPIENLDEMAANMMMKEDQKCEKKKGKSLSYQEIASHVRLLQEYEVLFWDACYSAKAK